MVLAGPGVGLVRQCVCILPACRATFSVLSVRLLPSACSASPVAYGSTVWNWSRITILITNYMAAVTAASFSVMI
jgi:hypothetical protein